MNRAQRNRAARLARRVEIDGRLVAPLPPERHGLQASYTNWGCRCEDCTRANSSAWVSWYQSPYVARQRRQDGPPVRGAAA